MSADACPTLAGHNRRSASKRKRGKASSPIEAGIEGWIKGSLRLRTKPSPKGTKPGAQGSDHSWAPLAPRTDKTERASKPKALAASFAAMPRAGCRFFAAPQPSRHRRAEHLNVEVADLFAQRIAVEAQQGGGTDLIAARGGQRGHQQRALEML